MSSARIQASSTFCNHGLGQAEIQDYCPQVNMEPKKEGGPPKRVSSTNGNFSCLAFTLPSVVILGSSLPGVGKTELAKTLASQLFDSEERFCVFPLGFGLRALVSLPLSVFCVLFLRYPFYLDFSTSVVSSKEHDAASSWLTDSYATGRPKCVLLTSREQAAASAYWHLSIS